MTEAERDTLWRILEARDEAVTRAHQLYQGLYRELGDKQLREKESTLRDLAAEAAKRLELINSQHDMINSLLESRYYRLGFALLHPAQTLVGKLARWRR